MNTSTHATEELRSPGPLLISGRLKAALWVSLLFGVIVFVGALLSAEPKRAWSGLIINHFFFTGIAIGSLFFVAIQWVTGAMWSAPVRRLSEAFTSYLPWALIPLGLLFLGMHDAYHWSHHDVVEADPILKGKASYLNIPFFVLRNVLALGLWVFFARKMVGGSLSQDSTGDIKETIRNRFWSPIFIIVFALTFTMVSFDQLMSLDPHWFSTIFGVYCFSGVFYAALAALAIIVITLRRQGVISQFVNENHIHDIGKLMFAFTVFWAYIGFSQFMLIWYANLPEETGYFLKRFDHDWIYVSVFLLLGKFMGPFFLLLPRDAKRDETHVYRVAWFMLFAEWVDIVWMVGPEFYETGPQGFLIDLGIGLGFLGGFGLVVGRFLGRHNIVAIGDPKLHQSVFHHHQ